MTPKELAFAAHLLDVFADRLAVLGGRTTPFPPDWTEDEKRTFATDAHALCKLPVETEGPEGQQTVVVRGHAVARLLVEKLRAAAAPAAPPAEEK